MSSLHDGGEQAGKGRFDREAGMGKSRWTPTLVDEPVNLKVVKFEQNFKKQILHCGHESMADRCSDPKLQNL